ncbi:MAG: hypothetical protein ACRECX_12570 [Methyloceanibacter sp.]
MIGELDYRTEEEYAKEHGLSLDEVRGRYAATGVVECGGKAVGSAQLTAWGDVVTTAAHIFVNPDNCAKWPFSILRKTYWVMLHGEFLQAVKAASGAEGEFIEYSVRGDTIQSGILEKTSSGWLHNGKGHFAEMASNDGMLILKEVGGDTQFEIHLDQRTIVRAARSLADIRDYFR